MRSELSPSDVAGLWSVDLMFFPHAAKLVESSPLSPKAAAPLAEYVPNPTRKDKRLAVLTVGGFLSRGRSYYGTSTQQLRQELKQAAADPSVSGILLAVDSPGGTVAGTPELVAEVQAAKRKKPVWAHVSDLAASAAYWVASQADQVWANPTAIVGSVGTIVQVEDVSAALEKAGVKIHTFATGPLKATGKTGEPMTDERKAMIQALVDDSQTLFDAAVQSARGLTDAQLAEVRKGGAYAPTQAKTLRLIDGIRPLEKTVQAMSAAR